MVNENLRIRRADQARPTSSGAITAQVNEALHHWGWTADQRRWLYRTPLARRRGVLAFGDMVITDAYRLHDGLPSGQPGRPGHRTLVAVTAPAPGSQHHARSLSPCQRAIHTE